MDVFDFILKAIFQESEKSNVFFTSETCNITNSIDEKFDKAVNRLAYLYKHGIFNAYFIRKCFSNFVDNFSESSKFIDQIFAAKVVCSLSIGPGTDILGLISAFRDIGKTFSKNKSFKIISNNGAWRNSMNALTSVVEPTLPILGTFKLLQSDILKSFSSKAKHYLKEADVVMMDHAFASPTANKHTIVKALINILMVLQPGTLVIIIDTKAKMSYYQSLYMFGEFVYGPIEINVEDIPYRDNIVKTIGVEPKRSGKSHFGIWYKSSPSKLSENKADSSTSSQQKLPDTNISKLEKTASILNFVPARTRKDSNNPSTSSQPKLPDTNIINKNKYGSDDSIAISDKSENKHSLNFSSLSQNSQQNPSKFSDFDDDFKKLLRSLDGLVTKLEQFVDLERNSVNCNSICRHQLHSKCVCLHNFHTIHCKSCMHYRCFTDHCEIKHECAHELTTYEKS